MSKGTVIYIGGFELPDKNAAAHRVLSNAKILRELDYMVVFIDVDKDLPYESEIVNKKKEIQGFENWSVPYPQSKKQWIDYLCNIKSFLEVIEKYSDVKAVICYNYQAVAFMKIKKYCNQRNIKIIADCTEWYSTKGASIIFKIIKGFDSFLRMRVIQKRIDGLIVISRYLERYYEKCKNVICIPPLVDLSEEKWNVQASQYDDGKIRFVYAGAPGKNKDKLNLVIECLYELKDFSNYIFDVVGITKQQYLADYAEHTGIMEELNYRVNFHGRISHSESLKYVKIADFSTFIREITRVTKAGFPTKYVESVSCGALVITTRNSDLEEYLVDGENGYFLSIDNKNNIVSRLKKILLLNRGQIANMKRYYADTNPFVYQNYINKLEGFLLALRGGSKR